MTVRRAGAAHALVLAGIHAAAFPDNEAWNAAIFAAQLGQPGVAALLHGAEGLIVMRVAADEAEILTLAVVPQGRRRGVGRALLDAGCLLAQAAGAARVFLEVSARNGAAQALYTAAGFGPVGRRKRYYDNKTDAVVMARDLTARQIVSKSID